MALEWHRTPGSRAIYAIGKDVVTGSAEAVPEGTIFMHIAFRVGATYVYKVPDGIFEAMKNAPSKGRYYVFVVKARWDYIRKY